jgi:hypothetical protein
MLKLPTALCEAIERGELTEAQLRELITLEAKALGLGYEEAVLRARAGTLPERYPLRADLELLVDLLAA